MVRTQNKTQMESIMLCVLRWLNFYYTDFNTYLFVLINK